MIMDFSATFLQFQTIYYIKYYKRQLEKSSLKIPFSYLQFRKKPEKAILWSQIHFWRKNKIFLNVARFACKRFWAYSKLVGTPCSIVTDWSLYCGKGNEKEYIHYRTHVGTVHTHICQKYTHLRGGHVDFLSFGT